MRSTWVELMVAFLKLGCLSFGGPVAHLGYLHHEFVQRRRWLDEAAYADLVALCQFLPGPSSGQIVFALGMRRAGLGGALLASLCFTLPSAVLMILFAYGVNALGDLHRAGWLHGLKLAAVAVVAQAVWRLGRALCPDRARLTLALAAGAIVLLAPNVAGQVGAIAGGAVIGWWLYRLKLPRTTVAPVVHRPNRRWAMTALLAAAALLIILPLAATSGNWWLMVFDGFYRAGALVFGGGHIVLPLLRAEVVTPGWIDDGAFLAGYGAAQALPGPLFTFAAYLGTVMEGGRAGWIAGLWCLLAILLPGWMLIGGTLSFWDRLRSQVATQAALRGANASVVGLLLAALYNPVWTGTVAEARDVAAVLAAFALLELWRLPPWLVVMLAAVAGEWLH